MAQQDITITDKDRKMAMEANKQALLRKIQNMPPHALAGFLDKERAALVPFLKRNARELYTENADQIDIKTSHAITLNALKRISLETADKISYEALGLEKTSPQVFAKQRIANEIKRAAQLQSAKAAGWGLIATPVKGLYNTVSGGVILIASPIIGIGKMGGHAFDFVHGLAGTSTFMRNAIASAGLAGLALWSIQPTSAAPYVQHMDTYRDAFKEACKKPHVFLASTANATYSLYFDTDKEHSIAKHTHDTMMMAARHGVPAVGMHLIGYFETGRFTAFQSKNSSASGPTQTIDSTKMLYMKNYGKKTFLYQDAKSRMDKGTASPLDESLVRSINAISSIPLETLNAQIKSKNYAGYVHDAMVHADTSAMAVELVTLDLLKKYPELAKPDVKLDRVVEIVTDYYAKDHFLGAGNHATLVMIANKTPQLSITNYNGVKKAYGDLTAANLQRIVEGNPALLKKDMTAPQALTAIRGNFQAFVQAPLKEFKSVYNPAITTLDLCLKDKGAGQDIPRTVTRLEGMLYDAGLMPLAKKFIGVAEPTAREGLKHIAKQFNGSPVLEEAKSTPAWVHGTLPPKRPDFGGGKPAPKTS